MKDEECWCESAVLLKRVTRRGQCQSIVSSDKVRVGPSSLVGNMSDETVGEEPSSQSPILHPQQRRNLSKIITAKVVTQLTNLTRTQSDDRRGDDILIGRVSRRDIIESSEREGQSETAGGECLQLSSTADLHTQQICIVRSNPDSLAVNNSDGNHLNVHRIIRSSAGTEDIEEDIEECCVTGGEEGTEVLTDDTGKILTAVVTKHRQLGPQTITVSGVSLADIHHQQEHETLIEVDDPLQHHHTHHHVQHHPGGTVSVNMGNHHHHEDSAGNTIITIPVSSLAPYTVIGDSETNGTGTISVSLAQESVPMQQSHHSHQQQHQLVQQSISASSTQVSESQQQSNSHLTWEEAVSAPVLPIRCKDTNAELHKSKFGSGNKGKCIKLGGDWFTPTEFEALCGRGNSKDWKRSIRFGGRTLQTLIDKGFLIPHASSCICSNCVDDATATGPIRPFTPYQRKRKGQGTEHSKATKLERLTSKDSNTDESSDVVTPVTPLGQSSNLNPLAQAFLKVNQVTLPPCTQEAWKVVEDAVDGMASASTALKTLLQELKERTNQETDSLRSQLQNAVQTTLVQNPIVGQPQILRIFDSNRIQTYSIEVLDPESFKPLPTNTCENCGREGTLECSGCHVVHYCSSFCQKKDWPNHQTVCTDRRQSECKQEPQLS